MVFAHNSDLRAQITPARRGKRPAGQTTASKPEQHRAATWARHLKRVSRIDVEVCEHCDGAAEIIACIEHPDVIERILSRHWGKHEGCTEARHLRESLLLASSHPGVRRRIPHLELGKGIRQLGTGIRMWPLPTSLD